MTAGKAAVLSGLAVVAVIAAAAVGGYSLGTTIAPTKRDARAARSQADDRAFRLAFVTSRRKSKEGGRRRGLAAGRKAGDAAGSKAGSAEGGRAAQAEADRIAAEQA